jgi:hypothetical protein
MHGRCGPENAERRECGVRSAVHELAPGRDVAARPNLVGRSAAKSECVGAVESGANGARHTTHRMGGKSLTGEDAFFLSNLEEDRANRRTCAVRSELDELQTMADQ